MGWPVDHTGTGRNMLKRGWLVPSIDKGLDGTIRNGSGATGPVVVGLVFKLDVLGFTFKRTLHGEGFS